ncbi:hypothetical protein [Roseomonas chloroacetimidivorans]|jgi:hypothetical protein|uniref:hypothetical protein n=1 Tax=Roseomonas chloroacetimidivorans TaxID=1766656 RepID=UPI003C706592
MSQSISSPLSDVTIEIIRSLAKHAQENGLEMADEALMAMLEVLHGAQVADAPEGAGA